jgi:hypothetical protein
MTVSTSIYMFYIVSSFSYHFPILGDEILKCIGKQVPQLPRCLAPQRGHWDRMRPQQRTGRGSHLREDSEKTWGISGMGTLDIGKCSVYSVDIFLHPGVTNFILENIYNFVLEWSNLTPKCHKKCHKMVTKNKPSSSDQLPSGNLT